MKKVNYGDLAYQRDRVRGVVRQISEIVENRLYGREYPDGWAALIVEAQDRLAALHLVMKEFDRGIPHD